MLVMFPFIRMFLTMSLSFRARYFMFIRCAAFHLQQLSSKRQRKTSEQKSIEANKVNDKKEAAQETEKETKKDKSQEKGTKDKKQKKDKQDTAKKTEAKKTEVAENVEIKEKDDELLLNENYSEIDTDVAKKIVESITDSICSGEKSENDCKFVILQLRLERFIIVSILGFQN